MIEELIAQAAVQRGRARGNPVNREAGMVLAGHVSVETSAVLFEIAAGRITDAVLGDVRGVGKSTADTGCAIAHVTQVLRAQAGGQRRTDVQALTRDGSAIYAFAESGIRAGYGRNHGAMNCCSLEVEVGGGNAVCGRQGRKGGGGEPLRTGRRHALALSLVGEKGKYPV